jgi:hypothetical protein
MEAVTRNGSIVLLWSRPGIGRTKSAKFVPTIRDGPLEYRVSVRSCPHHGVPLSKLLIPESVSLRDVD